VKLFHEDVQWVRVLTHHIHGWILGICCWYATTGGIPRSLGAVGFAFIYLRQFIQYEENEDRHKADEAWHDYLGCLFGMGEVFLVYVILRFF